MPFKEDENPKEKNLSERELELSEKLIIETNIKASENQLTSQRSSSEAIQSAEQIKKLKEQIAPKEEVFEINIKADEFTEIHNQIAEYEEKLEKCINTYNRWPWWKRIFLKGAFGGDYQLVLDKEEASVWISMTMYKNIIREKKEHLADLTEQEIKKNTRNR